MGVDYCSAFASDGVTMTMMMMIAVQRWLPLVSYVCLRNLASLDSLSSLQSFQKGERKSKRLPGEAINSKVNKHIMTRYTLPYNKSLWRTDTAFVMELKTVLTNLKILVAVFTNLHYIAPLQKTQASLSIMLLKKKLLILHHCINIDLIPGFITGTIFSCLFSLS